jgi:glycosyltransferase involved in cell wall biosynthesis
MQDNNLKILYIDLDLPHLLKDDDYPAGGIACEWLSWIEGIKQTGHKFGLLTWEGANEYINKDVGFDIVESYSLKKGIPVLRLIYYRIPKFFKAVKNYCPDVIVQEGAGNLTFMSAITAKILKKTFVYRIASDRDIDNRIKNLLGKRTHFLYKIALRNTDIFVCQNEYQYNILKKKFPNKKIFTLYNPYITQNNSADIINRNKGSFIAWVGNFRHEKNIAALVSIAKSLPQINFKIAGKPLSTIDETSRQAVEELKKMKNVEFVGYLKRSEILPFLSNAIALLNTSYLEGFSNSYLEAWEAGIPVITTKNANPDNVINNYKLGIVANTYTELPDIIKKVVEQEADKDLPLRCKEYLKKHHDAEILANNLISLIK